MRMFRRFAQAVRIPRCQNQHARMTDESNRRKHDSDDAIGAKNTRRAHSYIITHKDYSHTHT